MTRACGPCTVCCTVASVPELGKGAHARCKHAVRGGCGIYEARPRTCRAFACDWLRGEMSDAMRPDKVGVMLERVSPSMVLALAYPRNNTAWLTAAVDRELSAAYVDRGVAVAMYDRRAIIPFGMTAAGVAAELERVAAL